MEPLPGVDGTGPRVQQTAGCCDQVAGGQRLALGPAAAARGLRGRALARSGPPGRRDPQGTLRGVTGPGPPPLAASPGLFHPSPMATSRSLWGQREGGAPGHPAMQATAEKPVLEVTHLAPLSVGPGADAPDHRNSHCRDFLGATRSDARGCETPFPLNAGLAVLEAEQAGAQGGLEEGRGRTTAKREEGRGMSCGRALGHWGRGKTRERAGQGPPLPR